MDDDTAIEVFKYLDYCQLAKKCLVSKEFRDVIQTHRHKLALLYVDIGMKPTFYENPAGIKIFNKELSAQEYNAWVIRNQYSKQVPCEGQVGMIKSLQNMAFTLTSRFTKRDIYEFSANARYKDPNNCRPNSRANVFFVRSNLNHGNWPLFEHFVRLLTDPFVYIRFLEVTPQNDVFKLLMRWLIDSDGSRRLQCKNVKFHLDDNDQEFLPWIKNNVLCNDMFHIYSRRDMTHCDEELLDFFLTGALCTQKITLLSYDISKVIVDLVQKFMDLKKCDDYQVVEFIKCHIPEKANCRGTLEELNRKYAKYIVNEYPGVAEHIFELLNVDIGKKLQLRAIISDTDIYRHGDYFQLIFVPAI
ncbi:hypothetical protein Ddc_19783 [Ditylenchus destructor]|nr:hypothetical protein Ddc_19783 [Ditylenchus destructor]